MKKIKIGFGMIMVAMWVCAAPQSAGYPFDGTTGFTVSNMTETINAQAFTVSAWIRLPDVKRSQMFLTMGQPNQDLSFYLYNGAVRMLIEGTEGEYGYALAKAPKGNEWSHYVGTYDGKTAKIYRDGKLEGQKAIPFKRTGFKHPLTVGMLAGDTARILKGSMTDIRVWNKVLNDDAVQAVFAGEARQELSDHLISHWNTYASDTTIVNEIAGAPALIKAQPNQIILLNTKVDGFHGIWYYNQKSGDEYVYKYSGGLGTYCAKHRPMAWYAKEADKTFFCYGGADAQNSTLFHMISYYDHKTGLVARPTLLLDKKTNDAHDNPVINLDDKGYIWIFSSSHGTGRPSFISRSVKPYDIDEFKLIWQGNFSYPQPMYFPGKGFMFMHTWYTGGRSLYLMTSNPDGTEWSERRLLSRIEMGQYQVCNAWKDKKMGTAFNMHPKPKGLNWRTNLYYMESDDFGKTWKSVDGKVLETPLTEAESPALVAEYKSKGLNVYMKDLQFDSKGNPLILVVTSKGYEAGPANGPREWMLFHWNGKSWDAINTGIKSGNNYDTGSIYVESDTTWRIIGPTRLGPQPYNPGGEISMWLTQDAGGSWKEIRKITDGSERNHTYVRAPINAHPDFYGYWADGHGRKPSKSCLYFCNQRGDAFRLPEKMEGAMAKPEPVFR